MPISESEWDRRVLCSDGNCIGVVGDDGRCKLCGLKYEGALENFSSDLPSIPTLSDETETKCDEDVEVAEEEIDESGDEWENRILCVDEGCIGVVGSNGRCNECGKPCPSDK